MLARLSAFAALSALLSARAWAAPVHHEPTADEQVFKAMAAEMDRSLKRLKVDDFGPPYFLVYRLAEETAVRLVSSYGAPVRSERESDRTLYVEARVGDEKFDNTDLNFHGRNGTTAVEPEVLRHSLWNLTDEAYKQAIAAFLEKKARKATELDRDKLDDLARAPAYVSSTPNPDLGYDPSAADRDLRILSGQFKRYPWVHGSYAYLSVPQGRRYLLTSEGTRIATPYEHAPVFLVVSAWTRADDGMRLESRRSWTAPTTAGLPAIDALQREAKSLADELKALREAPVQAPLSAPAIMDPEFSGVFFHEALGHKLEGQRQRDPNESQVFRDMVGQKVIPEFLSVVDDPTMKQFNGVPLHGHYEFDSEGVPAERVALVEKGILKNFLMSRWPIKGFPKSNGHGRAGPYHHASGRMGNLMVLAHQTVSRDELKKRLMALAAAQGKPYGFLLTGSSGGENPNNRRAAQTLEVRPRVVYQVDAKTGVETPVRGVKLVGTPLVVLNRIVAAGDDPQVANPFYCGAESGSVPVNQISPSLLVSEVELQRVPEERARPPLIPSPLHDKD